MKLNMVSRLVLCSLCALISIALISGCGGGGSSSSSGTTGGSGTAESGGSTTAEGEGAIAGVPTVADLYKGSYTQPPTTPTPPAKGKTVWWISCGQSTPACAAGAEAAEEAAKHLGINFHIADGKFNVGGGFITAIQTALAANPDAIMLYGVDCEITRSSLEQAHRQGVLVLGVETPDCSEEGGKKEFNVEEKYSKEMPTTEALWKKYGELGAAYAIDATHGEAKVILNAGHGEAIYNFTNEGFHTMTERCSGCEILDDIPFTSADVTPNGPWISRLRTSLVQNPTANAVYFVGDVNANEAGGVKAVEETGREILTFGGQGAPDGLQLVREGKETAIPTARSPGWSGWAAMDTINRALQNEPTVPEGIGFALVDQEHGLPPNDGESYEPAFDYKAAYLKAWGVK